MTAKICQEVVMFRETILQGTENGRPVSCCNWHRNETAVELDY